MSSNQNFCGALCITVYFEPYAETDHVPTKNPGSLSSPPLSSREREEKIEREPWFEVDRV